MIRSTRALAVPFALLAALSTVATRAQAQITTWSDRTAFVNAVGSVTTENFLDNAAFPLGSTLNSTSSYNEGTWAQVLPGDIKAGVTYSVSSGPLLIDGGGGFEGGFLDGIGSYGTVGPLTATFDGSVKGFGFLTNYLMGSQFDVIIAFRNGSTSSQLGINNENGLQFFGFSSENQDIASVTIGGNGSQGFNFALDDFTFSANAMPSTSVPEPSTFALMAAGGLVMAGVARRRKQA